MRWEPIDDRSARATLNEQDWALTMTFTFGAEGLVESVRADARGRTVGGRTEMRPWEGRYSDHAVRDGMTVPLSGEVAWLLPPEEGGRKPYWRGTIRTVHYDMRP